MSGDDFLLTLRRRKAGMPSKRGEYGDVILYVDRDGRNCLCSKAEWEELTKRPRRRTEEARSEA
jgi:hypothetical protein